MNPAPKKTKGNMYTSGTQSQFNDIILQPVEESNQSLQFFSLISKKYPINLTKWLQISAFKKRVQTSKKNIIIFKIVNMNARSKATIIYSHGISKDLDKLFPYLIDMASFLKCCIISYDYSDYDNKHTIEDNLSNDLETVINFASDFFKIRLNDMFLLSSSLGSIPVFSICARERFKKIRGIIAVSPISYGACIYNVNISSSSKIELSNSKDGVYSNAAYAEKIFIPTLLIHGMRDRIIPYDQSVKLNKLLGNSTLWTPINGSHDNIFSEYRTKFYIRLKRFINEQMKLDTKLNTFKSNNSTNKRNNTTNKNNNNYNKKNNNDKLIRNNKQVYVNPEDTFGEENQNMSNNKNRKSAHFGSNENNNKIVKEEEEIEIINKDNINEKSYGLDDERFIYKKNDKNLVGVKINKYSLMYFCYLINHYWKKNSYLMCINEIANYQKSLEKKCAVKILTKVMKKRIIFYKLKFFHRFKKIYKFLIKYKDKYVLVNKNSNKSKISNSNINNLSKKSNNNTNYNNSNAISHNNTNSNRNTNNNGNRNTNLNSGGSNKTKNNKMKK